jgi:hypothetical protein
MVLLKVVGKHGEYEIRQGKDGVVYCTCPAWRFGHGEPCKHMKERGLDGSMVVPVKVGAR